ncbi:MAG TPA: c-type cytochrome biogenesis protein CcmI [Gemmatimonadaceae bacterium]|nr:c-type cytochrome biogenesis protein CcmI [Gemmatimonadaceae bacterium]
MTALIVGTIVAVAALAFVLLPLFADAPASAVRTPDVLPDESTADSNASRAVDALREVEFDRATGKLSDTDYAALKAEYTKEAIAAIRAESRQRPESSPSVGGATDDAIEAIILRYRARPLSCNGCGPRPEPDALYCSSCGRYLAGSCAKCGAAVDETGARFCKSCGHTLAA